MRAFGRIGRDGMQTRRGSGLGGESEREARARERLEIDDELKLGWLSTKNHACA
jgi:hypothetical protein